MVSRKQTSSPSSKTKSGKRTVASLGKEVDALRAEVAALKDELTSLISEERAPAASVPVPVAAAVAVEAATEPVRAPIDATMAQIRGLLEKMFALACEADPGDQEARDEQFDRFLDLVHTDRKGTKMLDENLRAYTWHQMRRKVHIYLKDDNDPGSFAVTRTQPDPIDSSTVKVKLFLKARTRMPTPISVRRDAKNRDAWRIESSSL